MRSGRHLLLAGSAIAFAGAAVHAGETVTYGYDSLGRLIRVERNDGASSSYSYDSTDNRTNVTVTAAGTPPPPGNQSPVAVDDSGTITRCHYAALFSPLLNDYDPDGPTLTLFDASYSGALGTATLSGSEIRFMPNNSGTGAAAIAYSIHDSLGATATATLTVNIVQGQCP